MKNREKWADKLIDISVIDGKGIAVDSRTHKPCACENKNCSECLFGDPDTSCEDVKLKWLEAEYEPMDWSLVKVDTKVLVSDDNEHWVVKRYFAKYEDGKVYVWNGGKTSWSAENESDVYCWNYTKLYEEDEDEK